MIRWKSTRLKFLWRPWKFVISGKKINDISSKNDNKKNKTKRSGSVQPLVRIVCCKFRILSKILLHMHVSIYVTFHYNKSLSLRKRITHSACVPIEDIRAFCWERLRKKGVLEISYHRQLGTTSKKLRTKNYYRIQSKHWRE